VHAYFYKLSIHGYLSDIDYDEAWARASCLAPLAATLGKHDFGSNPLRERSVGLGFPENAPDVRWYDPIEGEYQQLVALPVFTVKRENDESFM
jgi:hypothetical protein